MDIKSSLTVFCRLCFGFLTAILLVVFIIGCAAPGEKLSALPEEVPDSLAEGEIEPEIDLGEVTEAIGESQQLTFGDFHNGLGSFHPSDDRLIFQSKRDDFWQIYELNLTDNSEHRVIISNSNDENPIWTTDGKLILFVSDRAGKGDEFERDIYYYDPELDTTARLTEAPADDWFPVPIDEDSFIFLSEREADQQLPLYYRQNTMYMGFLDGTEAIMIAGTDIDPSAPISWRDNRFIFRTHEGSLAIWSADDQSVELLTPSILKCGSSAINRKNDWLAFCAREEELYKLYLLDLKTNTLQLLKTPGGNVRYPQFSHDGNSILYSAETDGIFQMYILMLAEK